MPQRYILILKSESLIPKFLALANFSTIATDLSTSVLFRA